MQINIQEAAEITMEKEKVDTSEELHATKSQVQRQGKERRKAVKSAEKCQDTTNQSKSTRSKMTDSQASVKGEALKTKQKAGAAAKKPTKPVKEAKGPQKKVEEKESDQESERAARGRRKPPGATQTTTSQSKSQSKVKTGDSSSHSRQKAAVAADVAGEEAQNIVLRRSKRLASRR